VTTTTATKTTRSGLLGGRSPLLRLQSDERLIALMRGGNGAAFEVLFGRYRTRLLGFCRHMLGSKEDAEDVLQEVFANAYNAILGDQREINVRPWLYRIARNRCLNHLRRPTADASDTMDEHMDAHGRTAADVVHRRADVRHLLEDVQKLAESQRTALLLREIDALSYDQIAEAMETTIPSVKSLLVRARMSLAEAAEARQLSCDDVRRELAEVSEGLKKASPALRRHVRECEECRDYRTQLRKTTTVMALAFPIGPLLILKKLALAKLGASALAGGGGGAAAGGAAAGGTAAGTAGATGAVTAATTAATSVAGTAAAGGAAGGLASAGGVGLGAVATKAVAGVAVTAVIAGGAVEAKRVAAPEPSKTAISAPAQVKQAPPPPVNPTGGASLSGAPAELTKPAQEAPAPKPVDASTADPVTKPDAGATGGTGATDPAAGDEATSDDEAAPVTGSAGAEPETGGAAPPVSPPVKQQGTTGATGSAAGATGSAATVPSASP
jgi:RNA polymerase sigma factor (sigma-70 family)